jgi:putative restriction endonuclease
MANDFLFTWKPEHWPYEKLRDLVDRFGAGESPQELWRCGAHRMVKEGANAYLLRQGKPRGIFGIGTVAGPVQYQTNVSEGENPYSVPLTFRRLVDPTKGFLVDETELLALPEQSRQLNTQMSGVSFEEGVARAIDKLVGSKGIGLPSALRAEEVDFDPSNLADGRQKILRSIMQRRGQRQFREQLLAAYGGKCCVTNCDILELLEAAHIVPYRGEDTNRVDNGLLLRSDIHTLFDCGLITVDHSTRTLQVSERLRPTGYWKLNLKKLRTPTSHRDRPNPIALRFHQESWTRVSQA